LVWEDNFDNEGLPDTGVWSYEEGTLETTNRSFAPGNAAKMHALKTGIDGSIFPQKYYIDYVKVYRQK